MDSKVTRVAVIGGGISGLSAAYYLLKESGGPFQITMFESGNRWGGKITTDRVGGFVVEGGPDTFITTKPWAVKLCKELGISESLKGTNQEHKNTYILYKEKLHPLPGGLTMMIPTEFKPMLKTGLLSWPQKVRMGLDFFLPPAANGADESLGGFVTRRLGRAAYERLIEPLMSGIYAGDGDKLSLQSTFPYLRDLEKKHGGLVKGALAVRKMRARSGQSPAPGSRSVFLTPTTGLAEIVEALVQHLESGGVTLRRNTRVKKLQHLEHAYQIVLNNDEVLRFDKVVLATPALAAGALLADLAPALAADLKGVEYVSTATVSLGFQVQDVPRILDGYGYVIPRREGRRALACTWTSTKFPHRAPEGHALVRVFIGRAGQEGDLPWDRAGLLEIAMDEIRRTLGVSGEPVLARVFIWKNAMPQYNLGHPERLQRIDRTLEGWNSLALAGNYLRGIGIPDCIHSGEMAANKIRAYVD